MHSASLLLGFGDFSDLSPYHFLLFLWPARTLVISKFGPSSNNLVPLRPKKYTFMKISLMPCANEALLVTRDLLSTLWSTQASHKHQLAASMELKKWKRRDQLNRLWSPTYAAFHPQLLAAPWWACKGVRVFFSTSSSHAAVRVSPWDYLSRSRVTAEWERVVSTLAFNNGGVSSEI